MNEKVFAVSTGSYSDYRIAAIFSTREKAEAYMAEINSHNEYGGDFNPIEEFPLDGPREELPGAWSVQIYETGEVAYGPTWSDGDVASDPPQMYEATHWNQKPRRFSGYGLTPEHARRSAEEFRRQTLALEGKVVGAARQIPEEKDR